MVWRVCSSMRSSSACMPSSATPAAASGVTVRGTFAGTVMAGLLIARVSAGRLPGSVPGRPRSLMPEPVGPDVTPRGERGRQSLLEGGVARHQAQLLAEPAVDDPAVGPLVRR